VSIRIDSTPPSLAPLRLPVPAFIAHHCEVAASPFRLIIWNKDAVINDHQMTKGNPKATLVHRIFRL